MAQRYGGTHSPGSVGAGADLRPPMKGRARVSILMGLGALSAVAALFQGGALDTATQLVGGAILFAGGVVTREGLKAEATYNARAIARRPAAPRKAIGAAITGAGVGTATLAGLDGLAPALVYGAVAAGLHVASFGTDPMRDKGTRDAPGSARVARTVESAEASLDAMRDHAARTRDREIMDAVDRLRGTAAAMLRTVEQDPRDLTAARRYLGVYLDAARDAARKYADLAPQARDAEARDRVLSLIRDLARGMEAKRETLLIADRTDLEIEVETLRDRLRRDGVTTET